MNIINNIFFGLGLSSVLLGIPLTQILANNFNFFTINYFFFEITIFLIFFIICLRFFYQKIKIKSNIILIILSIVFFQIINIYLIKYTEYFFNDFTKSTQIITYLFFILFFLCLAIYINKKILFTIIKYLSILFFFQLGSIIYYSLNFNIQKNNSFSKETSNINNIFLIIFDELSLDFILNEHNKIKDEFINLKKFANNSSFFINTHSSFDFTSKAMLSLLTYGESLNNEILNKKNHYFKDITLYDNNLYTDISKTHKINVFASYDYCHYHIKYIDNCIANINHKTNLLSSINNYFYFLYLYSSPRFIINRLHNLNIINKDGSVKDYFINEINLINQFTSSIDLNTDERNFYLLHTNITHQPWVVDKNGKIKLENLIEEEDKINNINKLKDFYKETILYADNKLGEIFEFLNNNNIYDNSLIIILSDHGVSFDKNIFLRMNGKANNQISKVPLIIKKPFQDKPEVINKYANIIDLGSTIVNALSNNDIKYEYSRNLLNYNMLDKIKIPFLSVKEEYDITGKIIYNKKIYCENAHEIYELIKHEDYSDIFDICIDK